MLHDSNAMLSSLCRSEWR